MLDREDGLLASVSVIAAARASETEKSKEEHAGPRRNDERGAAERAQWRRRRRREKRGERRWRYAAQPWEPTAERASRAFHLASSSWPRLPPLSFSFYRASLSFSVSFCRLLHTPPTCSAARHRGPLSDSSPLFVVCREGNRRTSVFLLPLASSRSSLSSCGFSSTITFSSRSPSLLTGNRRYRCTHIHTLTHSLSPSQTQIRTRDRRTLFPRRTAPFFVPGRDSSPISFRSPVIN